MKKVIFLLIVIFVLFLGCSKKNSDQSVTNGLTAPTTYYHDNSQPKKAPLDSQPTTPSSPQVSIEQNFHGKENFITGQGFLIEEDRNLGVLWNTYGPRDGQPSYSLCFGFLRDLISDKGASHPNLDPEYVRIFKLQFDDVQWPKSLDIRMAEPFETENAFTVNFRLFASDTQWAEGELLLTRKDAKWTITECRLDPEDFFQEKKLFEDPFEPETFYNLGL